MCTIDLIKEVKGSKGKQCENALAIIDGDRVQDITSILNQPYCPNSTPYLCPEFTSSVSAGL